MPMGMKVVILLMHMGWLSVIVVMGRISMIMVMGMGMGRVVVTFVKFILNANPFIVNCLIIREYIRVITRYGMDYS